MSAEQMCQCGHTRRSHQGLACWACDGADPCDALGVSVKVAYFKNTWRWNLRCRQHGSLEVRGAIDDWEPEAVTRFRADHAGHE